MNVRLNRKTQLLIVVTCALLASGSLPLLAQQNTFYSQAQDFIFQRQYEEAIAALKRSIADEPAFAQRAATRLFYVYKELHRYNDAEQLLTDRLKTTNYELYQRELAALYRESGRSQEAIRLYEACISKNPNDSDALLGLGICLEAGAQFDAARTAFNRAVGAGGSVAAEARQHLARIENAGQSKVTIDNVTERGRWPASAMPIGVFVEDGARVPGYQAHMHGWVSQAVSDWSGVLAPRVTLRVVNDRKDAKIFVRWVPNLPRAIGVSQLKVNARMEISQAVVQLSTLVDARGKPLPAESAGTAAIYEARDRMMQEIALHELGHALGLEHSPRTDDIMADSVFGLNSLDVPQARRLTQNDVARMLALYDVQDSAVALSDDVEPTTLQIVGTTPVAVVSAGKAIAPTPTKSPAANAADMSRALVNFNAGKYEAAKQSLQSVLNRDPKNAAAHYLMAVALVHLRDYKQASIHYKHVTQLVPPAASLFRQASDGLAKIQSR